MAFTRFHDDPCRIQKYLEETTNVGNYGINVPGSGDSPLFINDPYLRMEKWGANLSQNKTELESDLMGITRKLNRDSLKENNYLNYNYNKDLYNRNNYSIKEDEITHQSRATHPAWTVREIDSINTPNVPNNFKYLFLDPQENVCMTFHNNISSRIVEKDYYSINTDYKNPQ
tara:strand:- start:164 stop:679 length:516 start_codon:yes stop_codon:yes gene_type:complete